MELQTDFRFPLDGDVLIGAADGVFQAEGQATMPVCVDGPAQAVLSVNGITAHPLSEGGFSAEVPLHPGKNLLTLLDHTGSTTRSIAVYFWPEGYHTYRFTVDDCIRAFENLHANRDRYRSIFDDPYLAIFHKAHEEYGSCTHINVFYESCDGAFDLSMMTDRYREEFSANADWLTFSFHSRGEFPDRPYETAKAQTLLAEEELVYDELRRIVGRAAVRTATTIHWGSANFDGVLALRDRGYRLLGGYFVFCNGEPELNGSYAPGETVVSYYLDRTQVAHLENRCAWVDPRTDMLFCKLHLVLNAADLPADRVAAALDQLARDDAASAMIQMVIHEQYFYPGYAAYEPDYAQRILNMAHWMQEHQYRPLTTQALLQAITD